MAARLASLLSWLARSFCFFLLLLLSSAPLCALLRLASPGAELLLLLLAIFSHLPPTGRLSLTSLPPAEPLSLGSESELRRFLPGPAILAALLLPEQNRVVLKTEQDSSRVCVCVNERLNKTTKKQKDTLLNLSALAAVSC